jgi:hypothetical protein
MADSSAERIAHHKEALDYDLSNYERAREVGSIASAERSLAQAADNAAILSALLALKDRDNG